jgi:hypothetical protein
VLAFFSFQDVLKPPLIFVVQVRRFKKMSAHKIMELLDDNKQSIPEGLFLKLSAMLMKKRKRERAKEDSLPGWVKEGSYCVMNDCLRRFLLLSKFDCFRRFSYTLRIDSIYATLPEDVELGQYEANHEWTDDIPFREDTGGVYIKCTPNMNSVIGSIDCHNPRPNDDDDWFIKPLWLEPWMFSMMMHVGEVGCDMPYVVHYPRARGWAHPTFNAMFENDVDLFDQYQSDDEENDFIAMSQDDLDDDHPMKWVGVNRGMRYGSEWKTVRDYLTKKSIVDFWCHRRIQS